MTAHVIQGKQIAARVRAGLGAEVARLKAKGAPVGLHVIRVGEDPASQVYVRNKARACHEAGIDCHLHDLPATVSQADLLARIQKVNADPAASGLIVQLPLPVHIDAPACLMAVDPKKDVDGFHPLSLGHLLAGNPGFVPCTPLGVMRLLDETDVPIEGSRAVVVGRGNVGLPLAVMLTRASATVTLCHSRTRDLAEATRAADLLIAAVGRPGTVTADMVKPGAVVIDVGINRGPDGGLAGDVDFAQVHEVAGWITPVPGGVGPMTVAMLLANTVHAARLQAGETAPA